MEDRKSECPVCEAILVAKGSEYSTEQLLKMWDVDFTRRTVEDHLMQAKSTQLFRCPSCKFEVFLPSVYGTSEFYSELQAKTNYYEEDKWDFNEALKEIGKGSRVLEIGCGPGNFLAKCQSLGAETFGSEYNRDAAKIAERKGIKILEDLDLYDMKGTFDSVFSFHVLEHVGDPMAFIAHHASMAKPGGSVCISVPNQDGPIKYIDPCIMNMPPHHLTRWKLKSLKAAGKKAGLRFKRVAFEPLLLSNHSYYSYFMVNSIFRSRLRIIDLLKSMLTSGLSKFFNSQMRKRDYFPYLKGMAIYVVFEKV